MAWNEPGGGKRNPWQGGAEPPNLDESMRRFKERFGRIFGEGGGGGGLALLIAAVLSIWVAFDSWSVIDERQRGVVLRFGKFDRVMGSGLNLKWPRPIEQLYRVDATQVRSTSDQVRMLTKDENIVIVDFNVQYQVGDPRAFLFGVREPEQTLKAVAESAVRQVIGSSEMDTILSGQRSELVSAAGKSLQETLDEYGAGLHVTEVSFQKVEQPQEVKEAFDDVNSAREDKQRIENEAQAYASKVVPEARGHAARVLAEAEGYKSARIAQAEGEAQRFALLSEQYRLAPAVTRKRLYLETMQGVIGNSTKILADGEGKNMLYLPLDKLATPRANATLGDSAASDRAPVSAVLGASEEYRNETRDGQREGRRQ